MTRTFVLPTDVKEINKMPRLFVLDNDVANGFCCYLEAHKELKIGSDGFPRFVIYAFPASIDVWDDGSKAGDYMPLPGLPKSDKIKVIRRQVEISVLKECYRPLDGISSEMRWVMIIPPLASRLPLSLQLSDGKGYSFSDHMTDLTEEVNTRSTLVASLERQNKTKDEKMRLDELERIGKDAQLISHVDEIISKERVKPQDAQSTGTS